MTVTTPVFLVDNVTIEIDPLGRLRIKDGGVSSAKLADGAATSAKIGAWNEISEVKLDANFEGVMNGWTGAASGFPTPFLSTAQKYKGTYSVAIGAPETSQVTPAATSYSVISKSINLEPYSRLRLWVRVHTVTAGGGSVWTTKVVVGGDTLWSTTSNTNGDYREYLLDLDVSKYVGTTTIEVRYEATTPTAGYSYKAGAYVDFVLFTEWGYGEL